MESLLALAATQLGLFTRDQARACDVNDGMLRRRVARGQLVRLSRRLFRIAGTPESWAADVLAACLAASSTCVASHRTAATLHRFDGAARFPRPIEVTVRHGVRLHWQGVIAHQTRALPDLDRCTIGAIPATTASRTLIDLGAVVRLEGVEESVDSAERDEKITPSDLTARFGALQASGRNGIATMRAILDHRGAAIPQSVLERRFLRLIEEAELPLPSLQHCVALRDATCAYIDAAYPTRQLGFELDGHRWHATRAQRAADNRRANELASLGWDIRRFSYDQVMREASAVTGAIIAALRLSRFGVVA